MTDEISARTSRLSTRAGVRSARFRGAEPVRLIAMACAGVAALVAAIGLLGWALDAPLLARTHPGSMTMKADTAIMLLLIAIAVLSRASNWLSSASAGLAAAIAIATILEYLIRHDLGLDQLLFTDPGGGPHPGRPSLTTAACALLLAVAVLRPVRQHRVITETVTLVVFAVSFLTILGYVYGVRSLYQVRPFQTVALHTATSLLLLSIAGLAGVERGVLRWIVGATKPGATLMRIVVPASLIVLPAGGYVCVIARRHGWTHGDGLLALNVVFCISALVASGWFAGVRLDRVDNKRKRALAELNALTQDLELQVVERSNQVQAGREEMVVLAERQRIAADLHDVVVQRLFAAGMSLNSVDPQAVDPAVSSRIDNAVESMDAAIMDLRASIFELSRSAANASDLTSALDRLCNEAARALGFLPDLTVDDPEDDAPALRADILAVTREALSNVAKHARATSVQVVLRATDEVVSLEIVDDGIGLTDAPHSSGTQNMRDRAARLGGSCEWIPVEPHGTKVRWHVPQLPVPRRPGSRPDQVPEAEPAR